MTLVIRVTYKEEREWKHPNSMKDKQGRETGEDQEDQKKKNVKDSPTRRHKKTSPSELIENIKNRALWRTLAVNAFPTRHLLMLIPTVGVIIIMSKEYFFQPFFFTDNICM